MISVSEELHTSLDLSDDKTEPPKRFWASDNHRIKQQFEDSSLAANINSFFTSLI